MGKRIQVSYTNSSGDTALHSAAQYGHSLAVETDQGTALHVAALYCKHDVVDLLLEKGIDAGDVNKEGHTAFEMVQQFAPDIAQAIRVSTSSAYIPMDGIVGGMPKSALHKIN
ncbi:hypothetical protein KUTeg_023714 [Tegillarca granosa]|uniref:Uncharacterized protein n=1 Tax=Tegillarca granosa TaxID=220873 RepID=A0ABQ9E5S3_TEGGR|nr:hypothetical protein KUTeg_023714 [Tegillarca granosa]